MKINILIVSQRPDSWVLAASKEYLQRFPKDWSVNIIQVPLAKRTKASHSETLIEKYKTEEWISLQKHCIKGHNIALAIEGKLLSSTSLANKLSNLQHTISQINFIIGGPDGLAPDCINKASEIISLSHLTLPHNLVRVILIEQLYRSFTILNNHPYHK